MTDIQVGDVVYIRLPVLVDAVSDSELLCVSPQKPMDEWDENPDLFDAMMQFWVHRDWVSQ